MTTTPHNKKGGAGYWLAIDLNTPLAIVPLLPVALAIVPLTIVALAIVTYNIEGDVGYGLAIDLNVSFSLGWLSAAPSRVKQLLPGRRLGKGYDCKEPVTSTTGGDIMSKQVELLYYCVTCHIQENLRDGHGTGAVQMVRYHFCSTNGAATMVQYKWCIKLQYTCGTSAAQAGYRAVLTMSPAAFPLLGQMWNWNSLSRVLGSRLVRSSGKA